MTEVDEFIREEQPIVIDDYSFSGYKSKRIEESPVIQEVRKQAREINIGKTQSIRGNNIEYKFDSKPVSAAYQGRDYSPSDFKKYQLSPESSKVKPNYML